MSSKISADARWMQGLAPPGIVTVGDPVLYSKTRIVRPRDRTLVKALAERMVAKMEELNAQGLAAPQVGENFRLIVIRTRPKELAPDVPESALYVMVNPEIVSVSPGDEERMEGCYSIPGLLGLVRRHKSVEVRWEDPDGGQHQELLSGYLARVAEHEVDHLDGLLWPDRTDFTLGAARVLTTAINCPPHDVPAA